MSVFYVLPAKADAALVNEIGLAAFEAIEKMPAEINGQTQGLLALTKALLDSGDDREARTVIRKAQSIGANTAIWITSDIFVQSLRAGDEQGALTFIQEVSEIAQLDAFDKFATEQARRGQYSSVDKSLKWAQALYAKKPRQSAPKEGEQGLMVQNFQFRSDVMLGDVGRAYATRGDIDRALSLVDKISNPLTRYVLLREVAKAQRKAGDEASASKSMQQLVREIEEYYAKNPTQMAWAKALSFGAVGAFESAAKSVEDVPNKSGRDALYEQLADTLAQAGDFDHAEEIAKKYCPVRTLVSVAGHEVAAGNRAKAQQAFLLALERGQQSAIGPTRIILDLSGIVYGLISVGEFAKAVDLSGRIDELNRPPFLLKAVEEEGRQGDVAALRATAPRLFGILQAPKMPLREQQFDDLIETLSKAGLDQETQTARLLAKQNSERLKTLGKAFLSPEQILLKQIDDDIARHELASAESKIPSLSGMTKDSGYGHLALAQAAAGRPKDAFETAKKIAAADQRAAVLTGIIVPAANALP